MAIVQETERLFGKLKNIRPVDTGEERIFRLEFIGILKLPYLVIGKVIGQDAVELIEQPTKGLEKSPMFRRTTRRKVYNRGDINSPFFFSMENNFRNRLFGITRWRYIPDPD